jgi:extradiol dioxygenase
MTITGLGYLGVQTPDPSVWTSFGPEVLGLTVSGVGDDGSVYLRLDERSHRLSIHPGTESRLAYAGWEVACESDLDAMILRLDQAGVSWRPGTATECAERKVERFVRFEDPAGLPQEIFYGAAVSYAPISPGRPMSKGFVTGSQGLGHLVFMVPDARAANEFYANVLGFQLSDIVDTVIQTPGYFYHCNSRHHSLGVIEAPHHAGLHHLMLELDELNDVGTAYDIVRKREHPMSMTLGRHSTDEMVSFYFVTPAGFEIEYGWGGRQVDDETWHVVRAEQGELWGHELVGTGLPPTVRLVSTPVAAQ